MDGTVALKDLHVELLGEVNHFPISLCRIVLTSCIAVMVWFFSCCSLPHVSQAFKENYYIQKCIPNMKMLGIS